VLWIAVGGMAALPAVLGCCLWALHWIRGFWRTARPQLNSQQAEIMRSRNASIRLHAQVGGTLVATGWALAVVGGTLLVIMLLRRKPDDAGALVPLFPVGLLLTLLGVRPIDKRSIFRLCVGFVASQLIFAAVFLVMVVDMGQHVHFHRLTNVYELDLISWRLPMLITCFFSAMRVLPVLCWSFSPRQQLRRLWATARALFFMVGLIMTISGPLFQRLCGDGFFTTTNPTFLFAVDLQCSYSPLGVAMSLITAGITGIVCALITTPANRGRFLRCIGRLGQVDNELQQAAAVGALLSDMPVEILLTMASHRFRTIPLAELTPQDLRLPTPSKEESTNPLSEASTASEAARALKARLWATLKGPFMSKRPKPRLGPHASHARRGFKSRIATLGDCDGFISHSWKDDNVAKYAALERWGADFINRGQQSPMVWLDTVSDARDRTRRPCHNDYAACWQLPLVVPNRSASQKRTSTPIWLAFPSSSLVRTGLDGTNRAMGAATHCDRCLVRAQAAAS
jgi:hypothetical protein